MGGGLPRWRLQLGAPRLRPPGFSFGHWEKCLPPKGELFLLRRATLIACTIFGPLALAAPQISEPGPPDARQYQQTYDRLLRAIQEIPVIDNHSHPGFPDDTDVDAMVSPPSSVAFRLRGENPEFIAAFKALFGYPYDDATPEHLKWLTRKKQELRYQKRGYEYFDRILNELGVEVALANRVRPASYLSAQHFRWVFFVDSLLFPFDNRSFASRNLDIATYVPLQENKLLDEMKQEGLKSLPVSLDEYLTFATRLLQDNQRRGGVAIKFEIGYFRSLRFMDPSTEAASAVYAKYQAGGIPSEGEYQEFQDYMFRYLIGVAGRLHLPVHIHSAVGVGDFYSVTGSTALNLENVLRDPRFETTTFVLLHGGYPYQDQAIWLAARKNVYLDSSLMGLILYPSDLKNVLRKWLLLFPEKVVYGSDAIPINDIVGCEELYWIALRTARVSLAAALAEMVVNREVSEERALLLARGYLHDNAAALYR